MTLFKKTSILALLAIFAKAPLAVAGEEKVHTDVEGGLPDGNHAVAYGGEYQSIPAAVADESVAGGESASAALSEFGHAYSQEATAELINTLQFRELWEPAIRLETIQTYIDNGADVNATDEDGNTSLMYALLKGNVNIIQRLLDNGANVNITNKYKNTALMWAVLRGHVNIVERLLDKGAKANTKDLYGFTALMLAVLVRNVDMIQPLLNKGADVDITDNNGHTALIWATQLNDFRIVQLLLEKGANVNATDNTGKTALDYVDEEQPNAEEIRDLLDTYAPLYVLK